MTIARAYLAAGEPQVDAKRVASFETWRRFVQRPLVWLGRTDPAKSIEANEGADLEQFHLQAMLSAWHSAIGDAPITVRALTKIEHEVLKEAMLDVAPGREGALDSNRFGKWLSRMDGRIASGLKLTRCSDPDRHTKAMESCGASGECGSCLFYALRKWQEYRTGRAWFLPNPPAPGKIRPAFPACPASQRIRRRLDRAMSATALRQRANFLGVELSVKAGKLRLRGGKPDAALIAELRDYKAEIINLLSASPPEIVAPIADFRTALAIFKEAKPYGITRFRHEQASWAAEMFLNEWQNLAAEFGWSAADISDPPGDGAPGLAYWLGTELVTALGPESATTESATTTERR